MMGMALAAVPAARADVWDNTTNNDNDADTLNELTHGTVQNHDLAGNGGADEDWYRFHSAARSSFEVRMDGFSGDFGYLTAYRYANDGTTSLQSAFGNAGSGYATSLRWREDSTGEDQFLRLVPYASATGHGTNDVYTIRSFETTYGIPRFNNSGTQTTVLQIQNRSESSVGVDIHFWNSAGAFLGTFTASVASKALLGVATASLGFAAGQSGSITVSNDGPYGALSGKAVALEPSTGFTFDTLMVPIPH
jgi:hypothetical protein